MLAGGGTVANTCCVTGLECSVCLRLPESCPSLKLTLWQAAASLHPCVAAYAKLAACQILRSFPVRDTPQLAAKHVFKVWAWKKACSLYAKLRQAGQPRLDHKESYDSVVY